MIQSQSFIFKRIIGNMVAKVSVSLYVALMGIEKIIAG